MITYMCTFTFPVHVGSDVAVFLLTSWSRGRNYIVTRLSIVATTQTLSHVHCFHSDICTCKTCVHCPCRDSACVAFCMCSGTLYLRVGTNVDVGTIAGGRVQPGACSAPPSDFHSEKVSDPLYAYSILLAVEKVHPRSPSNPVSFMNKFLAHTMIFPVRLDLLGWRPSHIVNSPSACTCVCMYTSSPPPPNPP